MLKQKKPAFRQGKHSVRLYAVRTRRATPGTPGPLQGEEGQGRYAEKRTEIGKGEPHEEENRYPHRTTDPS